MKALQSPDLRKWKNIEVILISLLMMTIQQQQLIIMITIIMTMTTQRKAHLELEHGSRLSRVEHYHRNNWIWWFWSKSKSNNMTIERLTWRRNTGVVLPGWNRRMGGVSGLVRSSLVDDLIRYLCRSSTFHKIQIFWDLLLLKNHHYHHHHHQVLPGHGEAGWPDNSGCCTPSLVLIR